MQPNEKEYVQLMKKRQWAIIYRLFGRSRTRETWPTLFPAVVPVKSSLNFMQIKDPAEFSSDAFGEDDEGYGGTEVYMTDNSNNIMNNRW